MTRQRWGAALVAMGLAAAPAAARDRSDELFWSVAAVVESGEDDRTLYGADFRRVAYDDDHAPPLTGYYGAQVLRGDGQTIVRGSGTFSILAFPAGSRWSFWLRPMIGVDYRTADAGSKLGALAALGGEVILRPSPERQVALTVDRIWSTAGTSTQVGIAFRWGVRFRNPRTGGNGRDDAPRRN